MVQGLRVFKINPSNTYILFNEISSYFYNTEHRNNFQVSPETFDQFIKELLRQVEGNYDNDFIINCLNFLVRATMSYENSCFFFHERDIILSIIGKFGIKIEIYVTQILWNVFEHNLWYMLLRNDEFIATIVYLYRRFLRPLGYLQNKILEIFTERCVYYDSQCDSK